MKRIFPVIVILITLSLLGIIVLQVSWFKDIYEMRQAELAEKMEEVGAEVSRDLSKQASSAPMIKIPRRPNLELLPEDRAFSLSHPTIAQQYSDFEIQEKLQKAITERGLKKTKFEYAISGSSNLNILEMQSANFVTEAADTVHNKTIIVAIVPETGSMMEGLIPTESLILVVPDFKTQVWQSLTWMIILVVGFTLIIVAAFALTVHTLLKQKKLSEIKSDFINNMTHEFKTPLATISLAVDALRNEKVQQNIEKRDYFNDIIKEENKRMNKHVETILQAALLDKQELKLDMKKVHAHDLVKNALNNYQLQIEDRQGKVELELNAANDTILADEAHFTNLLSNLIDNAIKYSKEKLCIKINTFNSGRYICIKVQDNGIGMNKETVKRVFEKFYRAHTGNIHNVKGFGLGMSYVKTVIDVHKGRIKADSTLGKGSCFTVEAPVAKEDD